MGRPISRDKEKDPPCQEKQEPARKKRIALGDLGALEETPATSHPGLLVDCKPEDPEEVPRNKIISKGSTYLDLLQNRIDRLSGKHFGHRTDRSGVEKRCREIRTAPPVDPNAPCVAGISEIRNIVRKGHKVHFREPPEIYNHARLVMGEKEHLKVRDAYCKRLGTECSNNFTTRNTSTGYHNNHNSNNKNNILHKEIHRKSKIKIHTKYNKNTTESLPFFDLKLNDDTLPIADLQPSEIIYTSTLPYKQNQSGLFATQTKNPFLSEETETMRVIRVNLPVKVKTKVEKGASLALDSHRETNALFLTGRKTNKHAQVTLNLDFRARRAHPEQMLLRALDFITQTSPEGYRVKKLKNSDVCLIVGNLYNQFGNVEFTRAAKKYIYSTHFIRTNPAEEDTNAKYLLRYNNEKLPNLMPPEKDKKNTGIFILTQEPVNWKIYFPELLIMSNSSTTDRALTDAVDYVANYKTKRSRPLVNRREARLAPAAESGSSFPRDESSTGMLTRSDPSRRSSGFYDHYNQLTTVMVDLLSYLNVRKAEDTTGTTLLRDLEPYITGYRRVGKNNSLAAVVDYDGDTEKYQRPISDIERQTLWNSQEVNFQERLAATRTYKTVDFNQKGIVKVKNQKIPLKKTTNERYMYVPRLHVRNPDFEPIAELFYGGDDENLVPIKALIDTGARAERILTACTLMSRWYFDLAIQKAPEAFRHIGTSPEQSYITLIDGTARVRASAQYYEFGLKAIGTDGKIVTDNINVAVVDKCIDAYQLVLGVDQFRRIRPEFPGINDPGNWIKFRDGPWKGMTVSSQTDHITNSRNLSDMAAMTEESKNKVANFEYDAPVTVEMPSMTCIDVKLDKFLMDNLSKLDKENCYVIRLDQRALASDLTTREIIVTPLEIEQLRTGVTKNLTARINNLSNGKRTLHLDELFRMESIGSNTLVMTAPGYVISPNAKAEDIFGNIEQEGDKDLSEEEISEMLDDVSTDFGEKIQSNLQRLGKSKEDLPGVVSGDPSKTVRSHLSGLGTSSKTTINHLPDVVSGDDHLPDVVSGDERSFQQIHLVGSLAAAKAVRTPVDSLVEQKTGMRCYMLDHGEGDYTIACASWRKKNKFLNYITIFESYDSRKPVGKTNQVFAGKFKIKPEQVVFLTPGKLVWDRQTVFLQKHEIPDENETKNDEKIEKVGKVAGMSKNSYKHEKKQEDDQGIEEALLKEIKDKKEKVMQQKPVDTEGEEWKEKVWKTMYDRFCAKLKTELDQPDQAALKQEYEDEFKGEAARYHEEGCPTPEYNLETAGVPKKENATWKVLPYFNLSHLDNIRLQWIVSEEVRKGNLVKWEPGMDLPLHASPAFIAARKGHLTGRMVVDFRVYNQQVLMPCFSMPNSENILADLTTGDAKYFGASDLATGYFHAQLSNAEIPYLALTTQDGIYFSKKLQLGPSWAPAWFQSRSRSAFPPEFHVYIDDILFKARSARELLDKIKRMHSCCKKTGFVLSLKKTFLGVEQVEALGHTVTVGGRCAAKGKIDLINNWPFPKTTQNLKSFVCVLVYLRDYIWKFAEKVYPLKKYLRGKHPTPISELATDRNAKRSIQILKNSIATKATIKHIDRKAATDYQKTGRPVIVYVDASQYAKSFVICQRPDRDRAPQIAVHKARSFSETERKWSTLERELNGMLYFVEEGVRYIEGVPTILLFDHKNLGENELQSIWCNKQKSDKISRWCDRIIGALQKLQIRRHYLPGQLNLLADVGSRYGHEGREDETEIPTNVQELVKTLFNTTDTDAKSLEEIIRNSDSETEETGIKKFSENFKKLEHPEEKLAAITIFAKLAAARKDKKESTEEISDEKENKEEKDFEAEKPTDFDNEKKNRGTLKAYNQVIANLDASAWKDEAHYKEEEHVFAGCLSAMKTDAETTCKIRFATSLTPRGYSIQGTVSGKEMGLRDKPIKGGLPTAKYNHWETYEKTETKWKPKKKNITEKRKEIEEHSLTDENWVVEIRTPDDSKKGYKSKLTKKAEASAQLIKKAKDEAQNRCIDHIRGKILEACPEPKAGLWYLLKLESNFNPQIKRWKSNYGLGPIEKLKPTGQWVLTEEKNINNNVFRIYKRTDENPTIGGRSSDVEVLPPDEENEGQSHEIEENDEIFDGLETEEVDLEGETDPDEDSDDPPEGEAEGKIVETNMMTEGTKYTTPAAERNQALRKLEIENRKANNRKFQELEKIIEQNWREYPSWERQAEKPEWERDTTRVFGLLQGVFQEQQYTKVTLLNKETEKLILNPNRIHRVVMLTRENEEPRIFPPLGTVHFGHDRHQIKITDLLENINAQPEAKDHRFKGAFIFSRDLEGSETHEFFVGDELERLKEEQQDCEELKWKIGYLTRNEERRERWLKRNRTTAQYRVEKHDLANNIFTFRNGLFYMNNRIAIPRTTTDKVCELPEDDPDRQKFKHLRTYLIHRAHKGHHDRQTTRQTITDDWGLTWPRLEQDIHHYEKNCLLCIIEKPVPKYTTSYVSEIYGERNHAWFLDHQGPFGPRNHKFYLLTVIDDATGKVWIQRTTNKKAETVVQYLKELFSQCDPNRLPATLSQYGTEDNQGPSVPGKLRADNGFGVDITDFCRDYAKKFNMAYTPYFVPGTAENPEGQHRIERPHRAFRRWIIAQRIEHDYELISDPDIAQIISNTWNHRKAYDLFKPNDCYYGPPLPFVPTDLETAANYRNQARRQLVANLTALRQNRSEQSHRRHVQRHGLVEEKYEDDDLVVLAHLKAKRKSKQSYLSNYRAQVFRVKKNKGRRRSQPETDVFLQRAEDDRVIRFKQPINIKKLRRVPDAYGTYLNFETDNEERVERPSAIYQLTDEEEVNTESSSDEEEQSNSDE